ncbi:PWWP domain-containing protein 2A, partial [Tupaia chinensis]
GSEVRVTLDHIIEDTLVVSFRLGEKLFSGVLMDLSKRFGPYGIPVTVIPPRDCKEKPGATQLQSDSFPEGTDVKAEVSGTAVPSAELSVQRSLWLSKPPPLFHEEAPYPPPLFIRDTYNQVIPQPPPRKIRRTKRKLYRKERSVLMDGIVLRPRRVLCDKCKNSAADDKDISEGNGPASDSSSKREAKKRRNESGTTVNKKLKTDHQEDGKNQNESQGRNVGVELSNPAPSRGRASAQAKPSKAQWSAQTVLQSKKTDDTKTPEVSNKAKGKAQKKHGELSGAKNAHPKGHVKHHRQNAKTASLPPQVRATPQRYRNEDNDSPLKTGSEDMHTGKMAPEPQSRCTSTRPAGEAPSENQSPSGPGEAQDTNEAHVSGEQDEPQTLGKRGSKSSISVSVTPNLKKSDFSNALVGSMDSSNVLRSSSSECSSSESLDFPPGNVHAPSTSSSSKEEKRLSHSLQTKVFSKNVSKCVTPDGRTICVGDIVWAKIYGFPWWPARILTITVSQKDDGLLVGQEAHISWFGSPTTSCFALSQLFPFLENFQSRFNKKRKGLYRKAITEAAKAARQLTPEVQALLTA